MLKTITNIGLPLLFIVAAAHSSCAFQSTAENEQETEKVAAKVEMLTLKVRVVDPDDHPIEGATISPRGLRTKAERASHWIWIEKRFGTLPKVLTDADGIAEVPYPKYVMEKLDTGQLTLSITHPNFVLFDDDRSVDDDPAEVQLERGFRIAVTAVDAETGEPIKNDIYGIPSVYASGDWELKKNGILVSPTLKKMDCLLRVVQFAKGKPTKFSESIEIKPGDRSRVMLKKVKLAVGTRVEGKLDDAVPRPIRNGHVAAYLIRRHDPMKRDRRNRWSWYDWAEVDKDGNFIFESLPMDEVVQLMPVCDGWVPGKVLKEDVLTHFPDDVRQLRTGWGGLPQVLKTDNKTAKITLPMFAARELKIKVVDPDDQPLSNIMIGCCPNQRWFNGGSQILGARYRTRDFTIDPEEARKFMLNRGQRYSATTDQHGFATISNLPDSHFGRSLSVADKSAKFELPIQGDRRDFNYEFADEGLTEITIKLQKKGTELMDGSEIETAQNARNQFQIFTNWAASAINDLLDQ